MDQFFQKQNENLNTDQYGLILAFLLFAGSIGFLSMDNFKIRNFCLMNPKYDSCKHESLDCFHQQMESIKAVNFGFGQFININGKSSCVLSIPNLYYIVEYDPGSIGIQPHNFARIGSENLHISAKETIGEDKTNFIWMKSKKSRSTKNIWKKATGHNNEKSQLIINTKTTKLNLLMLDKSLPATLPGKSISRLISYFYHTRLIYPQIIVNSPFFRCRCKVRYQM